MRCYKPVTYMSFIILIESATYIIGGRSSQNLKKWVGIRLFLPFLKKFRKFSGDLKPVTSVTTYLINQRKLNTDKCYTDVTTFSKRPFLLHFCYKLLQPVTFCVTKVVTVLCADIKLLAKNVTTFAQNHQLRKKFQIL